jgi:hypothetical protein
MPKIHARARVSMSVREKLAVERHRDAVLAREKKLEVRRERFGALLFCWLDFYFANTPIYVRAARSKTSAFRH